MSRRRFTWSYPDTPRRPTFHAMRFMLACYAVFAVVADMLHLRVGWSVVVVAIVLAVEAIREGR